MGNPVDSVQSLIETSAIRIGRKANIVITYIVM